MTQDYLKKNKRKKSSGGQVKGERLVTKFEVGKYVLLQYPNKPPDKLFGPMEIISIDRLDIIKV